jgi:beta-xylosidase
MMRFTFAIAALFFFTSFSTAQRLILPGDYPDPSVVKIGDTYWASATTSNWFPAYPILHSKDLINWTSAGNIFTKMPEWADYYFWAPEITYDNGKVYVYYSAHKKNGNLCLAVATADKPEGPYTDLGPVMCQEVGSIDGFPMRDENGKLHLIWKEDANSVNKPTPIWIMEMKEDRTGLIGEKKELFRNNQPWEGNLVEGVSMMKHGQYFYAFYAAAGCCGTGCTYTTGIARAKSLAGPWEKYEKNPVLANDENWKCPGHGTPVERDGKYYFMYHAYDREGSVYTGRQGLLIEFKFTPDGWIEFIKEKAPAANFRAQVSDNFKGKKLSDDWQWSVFHKLNYQVKNKRLEVDALNTPTGAFIGQKTLSPEYTAQVMVSNRHSDAFAGLAAIGDEKNTVSVLSTGDSIKVVQVRDGKETLVKGRAYHKGKKLYLRMVVRNGKDINFFYSNKNDNYLPLNETPVNGAFLPPWDRAIRVGLVSKGSPGQKAAFKDFSLNQDLE